MLTDSSTNDHERMSVSDVCAEHRGLQQFQLPNQTVLKERVGGGGGLSAHVRMHTPGLVCLRICIMNGYVYVSFNVDALETVMCILSLHVILQTVCKCFSLPCSVLTF